jgi:hypothetical protein
MNASFSEYVLYEPILRILTARGYSVKCEVECPGVQQPTTGDRKRLDFVASINGLQFAMEVKWAKSAALNVQNDYQKLTSFLNAGSPDDRRAFLCVFGRESHIGDLRLTPSGFREHVEPSSRNFERRVTDAACLRSVANRS